jgi:hypothetical protein
MAYFSNCPESKQDDKTPQAGGRESPESVAERPPFDIRELERLPGPSADDPPYLDWWAVEGGGR